MNLHSHSTGVGCKGEWFGAGKFVSLSAFHRPLRIPAAAPRPCLGSDLTPSPIIPTDDDDNGMGVWEKSESSFAVLALNCLRILSCMDIYICAVVKVGNTRSRRFHGMQWQQTVRDRRRTIATVSSTVSFCAGVDSFLLLLLLINGRHGRCFTGWGWKSRMVRRRTI